MTEQEKLIWTIAFASEMQFSHRPGRARWTAWQAVIGMRVAHDYRDFDTALDVPAAGDDYAMLEEMRKCK